MQRSPVTSESIAAIGYDAKTQTLEVEFVGGSLYQYFDVPQHVHEAFMQAESKGSFLNGSIKGVYRYAKV